jgi:hypothetical protein
MHIAPPRNVISTALCMCRKEGSVNPYPELFASASNKTPMRKDKYLSIGSGPGSHPSKPLALVIQDIPLVDMPEAVAPCEYLNYSITSSRNPAHFDLSGCGSGSGAIC